MNKLSYEIKVGGSVKSIMFPRYAGKIAWDDISCWTQVTRINTPKKKKNRHRRRR